MFVKRIKISKRVVFSCLMLLVFLNCNHGSQTGEQRETIRGGMVPSGTVPGNFTGFTVLNTSIYAPDCSILVQEGDTGLVPGTEIFGFTTDGGTPVVFSTAHDDDFSSPAVNAWWDVQNSDHGTFSQEGGSLVITSTADAEWGIIGAPAIQRNAPVAFQTVIHDFHVVSRLSISGGGSSGNGGLLLKWGANFLKFFYKGGSLGLVYVVDDEFKPVKIESVDAPTGQWLSIVREGANIRFSYSLDGTAYTTFFERLLKIPPEVQVGLYAARAAVVNAEEWNITPDISCTGDAGTVDAELITVRGLPFKNWKSAGNVVQFRMRLANSTMVKSPDLGVSLSVATNHVQFDEMVVNEAGTDKMSVSIEILPAYSGTILPGTETFLLNDRVPPGPPDSVHDVNPHADDFTGAILSPAWGTINELNGIIDIGSGLLALNSSNSSGIRGTGFESPFVYQRLAGIFHVEALVSSIEFPTENASGGLMLVNGTSPVASFSLVRDGTSRGVVVNHYLGGLLVDSIQLFQPGWSFSSGCSLGISKYLQTAEFYIDFNNGTTFSICTLKLDQDLACKAGFFASGGACIIIDRWDVSPSISGIRDLAAGGYVVHVDGLSVPTSFSLSPTITFGVGLVNGTISRSNYHALEPFDETWDGKGLLVNYGFDTMVITPSLEIGTSIPGTGQLDAEQLSNGNVVIAKGTVASGSVVEYNTTGGITREITSAGGLDLIWPHDVDVLDSGHWLITDTMNDRIVEIDDAGDVTWAWRVWDYFKRSDAREGRSHVNDADRLPNGNTLVSLRNLDTVVEINPAGDIIWSFGRLGMAGNLSEPHNPDRLADGSTVICDSKNSRILRVSFNGSVTWEYHGPDGPDGTRLGWVRDADVLPNGNVLIADGEDETKPGTMSRVLEIQASTGDVVWSITSPKPVYNLDIVDLTTLTVSILSPVDGMQNISSLIPIALSTNQAHASIFYQVYDETSDRLLDQSPRVYAGMEHRLLDNHHSYTIQAWAETLPGPGKDLVSGGDHHPVRSQTINFSFSIEIVHNLSLIEDLSVPFFAASCQGVVSSLNSLGQELLRFTPFKDLKWVPLDVVVNDVEVLPNGHVILAIDAWLMNGTNVTAIIAMDENGEIDWSYSEPLNGLDRGFTDVDYVAGHDSFLVVSGVHGSIIEMTREKTITTIWNATVFKEQRALGTSFLDNLQLDDVSMLPGDTFMFPVPSDDSILKVDGTGNLVWILNNTLNGSSLQSPRNLIVLSSGDIVVLNGTPSNIIKLSPAGAVTWDSGSVPGLSGISLARVLRLPNGQFLALDTGGTTIRRFSMTGTIDKVILLDQAIENLEPVLYPTPAFQMLDHKKGTFHDRDVSFNISTWINVTIDSLSAVLVNTTGSTPVQVSNFSISCFDGMVGLSSVLQDGRYTLELTANSSVTIYNTAGTDGDLYREGIQHVTFKIPFTVDVLSWFSLDAPCLVEGKLKLANTVDRLLSWSPRENVDNYSVFSHDSFITGLNTSTRLVATVNETWCVVNLPRDGEQGMYFVVVANNKICTSPLSNVLFLIPGTQTTMPWSHVVIILLNSGLLVGVLWLVYRKGLGPPVPVKIEK